MISEMETIAIAKFKATCLGVLEQVRTTGRPILVTKRGIPIAQILPPPSPEGKRSGFGSMPFTEVEDIVGPLDVDWEALR